MQIDGIAPPAAHALHPDKPNRADPFIKATPRETPIKKELAEPSPAPPQVENQAVQDDEKVKGVIRLLQEGHFKGVADVRLRINFFDELTALGLVERPDNAAPEDTTEAPPNGPPVEPVAPDGLSGEPIAPGELSSEAIAPDMLSSEPIALNEFAGETAEEPTEAKGLPELSPPSGKGVAYAKFLAIYNEMLGVGESAPEEVIEGPSLSIFA